MASKYDKGTDHQPQAKPIHFFKIILAHSLQQGKLMIPSAFVKKYGEGLLKTMFLKLPNGAEWKVNLTKCDGEIWFQKGWKEFADYHSLAHGHLLVFRYERTSHFQVHIFDMSALEIDYPFKRVEDKRASSNDQGNKFQRVEDLEDYIPGQKRKGNSSLEFLQPFKMGRNSKCVKVERTSNVAKSALHHSGRKCKGSSSKFLKCKPKNSQQSRTTAKRSTALERASSFKTRNQFFLVVMHPSYIYPPARLHLPSKFTKTHIDLSKKLGNINLQVLKGRRSWPAKYQIRIVNNTETRCELTSGWKEFTKDNNLKVGDVCTFELIGRTENEITFRIFIFRNNDYSNCPTSRGSQGQRGKKFYCYCRKLKVRALDDRGVSASKFVKCKVVKNLKHNLKQPMRTPKKTSALDSASSFKPSNPFFLAVMHPSYLSGANLNLPLKFAKRHFGLSKNRGNVNLLQVSNGKVWPARYLIRKIGTRTKYELSSGWKAFTKDNNLKVGDVCIFELIGRTEVTFHVYIFSETDNSICPTSQAKLEHQ